MMPLAAWKLRTALNVSDPKYPVERPDAKYPLLMRNVCNLTISPVQVSFIPIMRSLEKVTQPAVDEDDELEPVLGADHTEVEAVELYGT
jgi:hypothetical protein